MVDTYQGRGSSRNDHATRSVEINGVKLGSCETNEKCELTLFGFALAPDRISDL